jgi:hypothetical protein
MALLQGRDWLERQFPDGEYPIGKKLLLVEEAPFEDKSEVSTGKPARHNPFLDFDRYLELTVFRMKVGRSMISIIHVNRDAEESAYLRPLDLPSWTEWQRFLQQC